MSDYTPDRWVIIEVNSPEHGKIRKVLGSWYGGYAGSDSWRMNSGIEKIVDKGDYYEILGFSGSTYKCIKGAEGMSAYTHSIFDDYANKLKESGMGVMSIVDILEGAEDF
jgi:hypothetical protein